MVERVEGGVETVEEGAMIDRYRDTVVTLAVIRLDDVEPVAIPYAPSIIPKQGWSISIHNPTFTPIMDLTYKPRMDTDAPPD